MAWSTLPILKTQLGVTDTSQDAQLSQWLSQGHQLLVKELAQEIGNQIETIAVGSPAVVTSRGHGYNTGDTISIAGSNSTPTIDGQQVITVLDQDTFTVPVDVTAVQVTNTGWINAVFVNHYYSGDGSRMLKLRQRPVISVLDPILYDPNGYFGTPPAPATPFGAPQCALHQGQDWVLYIDNDRDQTSDRGWVARISGVWLRPNERQRGVLVSLPSVALGNLKLTYTAGRKRCPLDLQFAEGLLVGIMRGAAANGLPVTSESLDYYQYTLAGVADAQQMIGNIYKTLANHKQWRL